MDRSQKNHSIKLKKNKVQNGTFFDTIYELSKHSNTIIILLLSRYTDKNAYKLLKIYESTALGTGEGNTMDGDFNHTDVFGNFLF